MVIGVTYDSLIQDPELVTRRRELIEQAAKKLSEAQMIEFNETTNTFTITDLGRIAAKYYIRHASVEKFNKLFRNKMSEADVLDMISKSTEVCVYDFIYDNICSRRRLIHLCPLVRSNTGPRD